MTLAPPVAIVGGTGALGLGLAVRLGRAGMPIVIGSRDPARAEAAASRAAAKAPAGRFSGAGNEDAVMQSEIVILSVPFRSHAETLAHLKSVWNEGQLLIDATVPLATAVGGKATRTLGVWQGSAAQQAQEMVPDGVSVVSALHTVSAELLSDLDHTLDEDVLVCGNRGPTNSESSNWSAGSTGCGPLTAGRSRWRELRSNSHRF
jgi:8-hydroxy-5-deazaflavin:NADPH oxidoreductase